jgi:hypothetical protein
MRRIGIAAFALLLMVGVGIVVGRDGPVAGHDPTVGTSGMVLTTMSVRDPNGHGYWIAGADGGVFALGGAQFYGSLPDRGVRVHDIVAIIATPTGKGYWLVGAAGDVYAFGDAAPDESLSLPQPLAAPIVGAAAVPAPSSPSTAGGAAVSAFKTDASITIQPGDTATAVSIPITSSFAGNVLVQASGQVSLTTSGGFGTGSPQFECHPTVDGKSVGKGASTDGIPAPLAITGAMAVSAGTHTVTISCDNVTNSPPSPVIVSFDAYALLTPAG